MQYPPSSKIWPNRRSGTLCGLLLFVQLSPGLFAQPTPQAEVPMHLGFSSAMFVGINMTDARNSIKALTASIAREVAIKADPDPLIYENVDEAESLLRGHQITAVSMRTSEYWLLRRNIAFNRFLVTARKGNPTSAYLVLAREGSAITKLADLRDKRVLVYTSPSMCLAIPWLDVELAKESLPTTSVFFGGLVDFPKPAKVVLPVFFGQADACLITRYAYDTIIELNPQVGRQLRIVATSPDYVATLFGFRADLSPAFTEKAVRAFVALRYSVFGRQTLAIFQTEEIAEFSADTFGPSLALFDEHARLCPEANAALIASLHGPRPLP